MVKANIKVQKIFSNHLKQLDLGHRLTQFEVEMILKTIQAGYDLGHADGYAEGYSEAITMYNELEEENGNL